MELVNPLIGTQSERSFSHGNTYPAVARPYGMTAWTARTGDSSGWIYQYKSEHIRGLQATHQPSPWIGNYGHFELMPFVGDVNDEIISRFTHNKEISRPHYYQVYLDDYAINAELTATTRCSYFRIQYPEESEPRLLVDVYNAGSLHVDLKTNTLRGVARSNQGGVKGDFGCRFVMQFNCPFQTIQDLNDKTGRKLVVALQPQSAQPVEIRVGTSFISQEQADLNLRREIGIRSFDNVLAESASEWEERLSKISIEGATQDQLITFYSNLYRFHLFPRIFHEVNAAEQLVHYSPYSGQIEPGEMYTDNGFWDTFRAVYPLLSILDPDLNASILRGWLNAYREGGWFPKWASPGYRDCMIGTHVESLFADALSKGIDDFDIDVAMEACLRDATQISSHGSRGRKGLAAYIELGYVPCDEVGEATARTLEFAYDDWCVAQVAKHLDSSQVTSVLLQRSKNYRNVYDQDVDWMRGRLRDGSWRKPFIADEWGGPFTEGSAWHYSWSVLHDIPGLIELMGGDTAFIEKLDSVLAAKPTFGIGHYGYEIHEMTEMVAGDMGQYAHGNQPVHHMLYLYNFAGVPWKSAKPIRQVVDTLYGPGPDGYCGDEDNGQMSAWYIFSTLGFYPTCPGQPAYVLGTPRFQRVIIDLPNGNKFTIESEGNAEENIYVTGASLNDKPIKRSWIHHSEIVDGGRLQLDMSPEPNQQFGQSPDERPFSISDTNASDRASFIGGE